MGSFHHTPQKLIHTHIKIMKVQFILAACLAAAAFAAPIDNFVDPDCIEEDLAVEEPSQEIDAEFALGVPDLILTPGQLDEDNCVDDDVTEAPPAATEECDEPIETTEEPEMTTAEECVEETTEAPPADECAEDDDNEISPALNMRIEPAAVVEDIKMYGEESMIPDIEECEE